MIQIKCSWIPGRCADIDQLHIEPGRMDRVGLPEDEHSVPSFPWHDPGRAGLPFVASFRTCKYLVDIGDNKHRSAINHLIFSVRSCFNKITILATES